MRAVVALLALAACTGTVDAPRLERAEPTYAPLSGGTEVVLRGSGFAAPNRVFIGGREAPLVRTIDDTQLGIVVPPGDAPGDVEVVVLSRDGNTTQHGILHYSTPPEISAVSPGRVLYSSDTTRVTVTGSGFLDEAAGTVDVLVDGAVAADVAVVSDTELTFTAPTGRPLARPELTIVDARGTAKSRKTFRYVPSEHPGLLLFARFSSLFAMFVDPTRMEVVPIPLVTNAPFPFTTVVRDAQGEYWAVDQAGQFGHVDLTAQTIEHPLQIGRRVPTMVRIGDDYIGIDRTTQSIGRFDPATGGFDPISTPIACCGGSFGLAPVGETVYFTARKLNTPPAINTVDIATGELGTPITLSGTAGFHVEEMRAFDGRLYATSRDGTFVTIDPATGTVTTLPIFPGRANAMEIWE